MHHFILQPIFSNENVLIFLTIHGSVFLLTTYCNLGRT